VGDGMSDAYRDRDEHNEWLMKQDPKQLEQKLRDLKTQMSEVLHYLDDNGLSKMRDLISEYSKTRSNLGELLQAKDLGIKIALIVAYDRDKLSSSIAKKDPRSAMEEVKEMLTRSNSWGDDLILMYARNYFDDIEVIQAKHLYSSNSSEAAWALKWFEKQNLETPAERLLSSSSWVRESTEKWLIANKISIGNVK
jgi:hypothetical protein